MTNDALLARLRQLVARHRMLAGQRATERVRRPHGGRQLQWLHCRHPCRRDRGATAMAVLERADLQLPCVSWVVLGQSNRASQVQDLAGQVAAFVCETGISIHQRDFAVHEASASVLASRLLTTLTVR